MTESREDSFILITFGWSVASRSSWCVNPDLFKVLEELSKVRRESRFDNVVSLYNFSLRYPRKGTKHLDCLSDRIANGDVVIFKVDGVGMPDESLFKVK